MKANVGLESRGAVIGGFGTQRALRMKTDWSSGLS